MTDTYQLAIIRFRWGHDNNSGSEHAINDQNYPLEVIHFTIKEDASLLSVDYSEKGFFKFTSLSISSAVFFFSVDLHLILRGIYIYRTPLSPHLTICLRPFLFWWKDKS